MTYLVDGPIVMGPTRLWVVSAADTAARPVRDTMVFTGRKTPLWVVARTGAGVRAFDMGGKPVDLDRVEAAAPGMTTN